MCERESTLRVVRCGNRGRGAGAATDGWCWRKHWQACVYQKKGKTKKQRWSLRQQQLRKINRTSRAAHGHVEGSSLTVCTIICDRRCRQHTAEAGHVPCAFVCMRLSLSYYSSSSIQYIKFITRSTLHNAFNLSLAMACMTGRRSISHLRCRGAPIPSSTSGRGSASS